MLSEYHWGPLLVALIVGMIGQKLYHDKKCAIH